MDRKEIVSKIRTDFRKEIEESFGDGTIDISQFYLLIALDDIRKELAEIKKSSPVVFTKIEK